MQLRYTEYVADIKAIHSKARGAMAETASREAKTQL
jgi:hypothetical protein